MVTEDEVLEFFRRELSVPLTWGFKPVPLELETQLQDYSSPDELPFAIQDFGEKFGIDTSVIDMSYYCPVIKIPFFKRLLKGRKLIAEITDKRPPLTVKMFAESAKAGRWLYD